MRLAYIVSRFPALTETFVLHEIQALNALNFPIDVFALRHTHPRVVHTSARQLERSVHFPGSPLNVLRGMRLLATASPFGGKLVRMTFAGHRTSGRASAKAMLTLAAAAAWSEQMRRLHIQHVHAHFGSYPALAALVAAELQGIGFSFTIHAHDLFADNQLLAAKARRARFVATISEFNRQLLVDMIGDDAADRVRVIHCGVDLDRFPFTPRCGGESPLNLVCVAALREYKGLHCLIDACQQLRMTRPELRFECHIVGDGPLRGTLERQIRSRPLERYVHLEGARDEASVQMVLAAASTFVLPSVLARNGYMDGVPVALMEAMATGVPVIASRLSGIPELVRDGVTGLLVPPGDASALCDAILRTWFNQEASMRRARLARSLVEREYDLHRTARQLAAMFATIE